MKVSIVSVGNSRGVRLPKAVLEQCQFADAAELTVEDGRVIITPHGDKPLTLAQRLALFDPAVHGGEAMAAAPVGRETW